MLAPAPGTFSTSTGWPQASESLSLTMRAITSAGPPGAKPTNILTGLSGKLDCAAVLVLVGSNSARTAAAAFSKFAGTCHRPSLHIYSSRTSVASVRGVRDWLVPCQSQGSRDTQLAG